MRYLSLKSWLNRLEKIRTISISLDCWDMKTKFHEVLIVAARTGTEQESSLTEMQQNVVDIDHDVNINVEDATWIHRYAAAVGVGMNNLSFNEMILDM